MSWGYFGKDHDAMDETMDDLMDFSFSAPALNIIEEDVPGVSLTDEIVTCINELLDSITHIEDNFDDFERREQAGKAPTFLSSNVDGDEDDPAEEYSALSKADVIETLDSAYTAIDNAILVGHIDVLPTDREIYKKKYKFPDSFANEDVGAETYESLCTVNKNFNEAFFDCDNIIESSIRPNLKVYTPIDETITKNEGFDHTAGFADYDILATKKKNPDILYYSLLPRDSFKENTAVYECSPKQDLDIKYLITEFQEFLREPENTKHELIYQKDSVIRLEEDEWDLRELGKHHYWRQFFQKTSSSDDALQWLFEEIGVAARLDEEGKCSQLNAEDGYPRVLRCLETLPEYKNPYEKYPTLASYHPECSGERESCLSTFPNYPCQKTLSSKLYSNREVKEYLLGLPFDYLGFRLPYQRPRTTEEYTNHLMVRVAINRCMANWDDSLGHLIFYKLFVTHPEPFFAQEAFRMFIHSARSLTHSEVNALARMADTYKVFDPTMHFILAVNHLRERNLIAMEEEILDWCYSLRYSSMDKNYNPFPENGEADKGTYKENCESVFICVRKAMVYNSCMYFMAMKYRKARELMLRMERHQEFEENEEEEILHWRIVMDAQCQVAQLNPYVQEPQEFFTNKSEFFLVSGTDNIADLESLIETSKTRIESSREEELCTPEMLKELYYRLLVIEYILLQYHAISGKVNIAENFCSLWETIVSCNDLDFRVARIERLSKALFRSYYLSMGISTPATATPSVEAAITRNNYDGYSVEGVIADCISNAYDLAYSGNFEAAITLMAKLEKSHFNGVAGFYNITIARSCIAFDQMFFNGGQFYASNMLKNLYDCCPMEAILREVPYQIRYSNVSKSLIRRIHSVLSRCNLLNILPTYQIRCHFAMFQIFMDMDKYDDGIESLHKARKIAKTFNMPLYCSMINRRLALVYACQNDLITAMEKLNKCAVSDEDITMPQLEKGMLCFTKFYVNVAAHNLKKYKPCNVMSYTDLSYYIKKATMYLKPFKILYKWMLAEEFNFLVHALKNVTMRSDVLVLQRHKQDLQMRITQHFGLNDFVIDASPLSVQKAGELQTLYYIPVHLI